MSDAWDLFGDVRDITAWLDADGALTDEDHVLKIGAELGEAIDALAGMKGTNRRKGVTHTMEQVLEELADVILAAACTIEHLRPGADAVRVALASKVAGIMARSDIQPGSGKPEPVSPYTILGVDPDFTSGRRA
jgi:NTP pyrophosphatase (non-canonical NTP hydrolase)